jgi:CheY-like chemotaxis protein
VITAGHGADALAKAQQQWPDLVISDCMMPVMNGLELCAALRSLPGGATLPIILCSGAPERHDLSQSSHNLFLRKPVSSSNCWPRLRACCRRVPDSSLFLTLRPAKLSLGRARLCCRPFAFARLPPVLRAGRTSLAPAQCCPTFRNFLISHLSPTITINHDKSP